MVSLWPFNPQTTPLHKLLHYCSEQPWQLHALPDPDRNQAFEPTFIYSHKIEKSEFESVHSSFSKCNDFSETIYHQFEYLWEGSETSDLGEVQWEIPNFRRSWLRFLSHWPVLSAKQSGCWDQWHFPLLRIYGLWVAEFIVQEKTYAGSWP